MAYSVLMSVYIAEKADFFVKSVKSMLEQTIKPDEIVLVCDGPLSDALNAEIENFSNENPGLFKIIRLEKNQGLGNALRIGLEACSNEYVARMDTDDIAVNDRIEKQLEYFNNNPDVSALGGQIIEFSGSTDNEIAKRIVPTKYKHIRARISKRNPMNHMTVMVKKSDVLASGNYRSFEKFEDYELWVRMLSHGYKLANLEDVLVYARVDDKFYKRRAGYSYFKQNHLLLKEIKDFGLCSSKEYRDNCIIRFVGTVVLPDGVRKFVYNNFLRESF